MKIRRATIEDAEPIHRAHMRSIQEICAKDYTEKEIQAWGHRPYREDLRINSIKNDLVWVVEDEGEIEGFGHLQVFTKDGVTQGYVVALYFTPKVTGKSLGKTMIGLMIEALREAKICVLTLQSTITSLDFYRKMGFMENGPMTTANVEGTPIPCYPMKMEW